MQYWTDKKTTSMTNDEQIREFQAKALDFQ
jgi:hypothetical protein